MKHTHTRIDLLFSTNLGARKNSETYQFTIYLAPFLMCCIIVQIVQHRTDNAEVMGSNLVEALNAL